jgi:hypothetical protein
MAHLGINHDLTEGRLAKVDGWLKKSSSLNCSFGGGVPSLKYASIGVLSLNCSSSGEVLSPNCSSNGGVLEGPSYIGEETFTGMGTDESLTRFSSTPTIYIDTKEKLWKKHFWKLKEDQYHNVKVGDPNKHVVKHLKGD